MIKPDALQTHLLNRLPELNQDLNRLEVVIDQGRIRASRAPGLSFEYAYNLKITLSDYPQSPDVLAAALLEWLRIHQPELLENLDSSKPGIGFQRNQLVGKISFVITVPLTERVIVTAQADGSLLIDNPPEPTLEGPYEASHWQMISSDGQLLAQWDNPT